MAHSALFAMYQFLIKSFFNVNGHMHQQHLNSASGQLNVQSTLANVPRQIRAIAGRRNPFKPHFLSDFRLVPSQSRFLGQSHKRKIDNSNLNPNGNRKRLKSQLSSIDSDSISTAFDNIEEPNFSDSIENQDVMSNGSPAPNASDSEYNNKFELVPEDDRDRLGQQSYPNDNSDVDDESSASDVSDLEQQNNQDHNLDNIELDDSHLANIFLSENEDDIIDPQSNLEDTTFNDRCPSQENDTDYFRRKYNNPLYTGSNVTEGIINILLIKVFFNYFLFIYLGYVVASMIASKIKYESSINQFHHLLW